MNDKLVIRYSKKNMMSWLAISFIALIAVGAYFQINMYVICIYILISIPLFITNLKLVFNNLKRNSLVRIWMLYILVGLASTLYYGRLFLNNSVFVDLSFFFIALSVAACTDRKIFYQNFIKFMSILSVLVLIAQITHVDFFGMLKAGSEYSAGDIFRGGGVSALFEYRHYYGIMLNCAFFMNLYYGKEKRKFLTSCILVSNIILTYTGNTWLAFAFGLAIYGWKEKKQKIKSKKILYVVAVLLCLFLIIVLFPEAWFPVLENIIRRFTDAKLTTSTYLYGGVRGYVMICGTQYILKNWKKYLFFGGGNGFALMWLKENPYGLYKEWTAAIDVQYITVLMNTGIIGLALIVMLIVTEIRTYISDNQNSDFLTSIIIIVMCVSFCFFDVFNTCTSIYAFWIFILCLRDKKADKV